MPQKLNCFVYNYPPSYRTSVFREPRFLIITAWLLPPFHRDWDVCLKFEIFRFKTDWDVCLKFQIFRFRRSLSLSLSLDTDFGTMRWQETSTYHISQFSQDWDSKVLVLRRWHFFFSRFACTRTQCRNSYGSKQDAFFKSYTPIAGRNFPSNHHHQRVPIY